MSLQSDMYRALKELLRVVDDQWQDLPSGLGDRHLAARSVNSDMAKARKDAREVLVRAEAEPEPDLEKVIALIENDNIRHRVRKQLEYQFSTSVKTADDLRNISRDDWMRTKLLGKKSYAAVQEALRQWQGYIVREDKEK